MMKNLKSWKTTAVGVLTGIGLIVTQLVAVLDGDPATIFDYKVLLAGLAALGIGCLAKDGDKKSTDLGL